MTDGGSSSVLRASTCLIHSIIFCSGAEPGKESPYEKYKVKDYEALKKMKKKLLLKFLSDYHPDRNSEKNYGKKWEVLAEEITKRITSYYECMK